MNTQPTYLLIGNELVEKPTMEKPVKQLLTPDPFDALDIYLNALAEYNAHLSNRKRIKASPEFIKEYEGKDVEHREGVTFELFEVHDQLYKLEMRAYPYDPSDPDKNLKKAASAISLSSLPAYHIADKPAEDQEDIWDGVNDILQDEFLSQTQKWEKIEQHFTIQRKEPNT